MWTSDTVRDLYKTFIESVREFSSRFLEEKNKQHMRALRDGCFAGADLIYQNKMPKDADVMIASIVNVIRTQLGCVNDLKGGDRAAEFGKLLSQVNVQLDKFSNACEAEIKGKKEEIKNQVKALLHLPVKKPVGSTALQSRLVDKDTLFAIINKIGYEKASTSGLTAVKKTTKRAAKHNPISLGAGVVSGVAAIGYFGVDQVNRVAADKMTEGIYFLSKQRITGDNVIPAAMLLLSACLLFTVLWKNRYKPIALPAPQKAEDETVLMIEESKEDVKDEAKQPLIRKFGQ